MHTNNHKPQVICLFFSQVWAAIPPWKQGSLAEFVVLSANEVIFGLMFYMINR